LILGRMCFERTHPEAVDPLPFMFGESLCYL
jgi:hypothetical protein